MLFPLHTGKQLLEASQWPTSFVLRDLKYCYLHQTTLRGDNYSAILCMHSNNCLEICSHKLSLISLSLKDKHVRKRLGKISSDFQVVRNNFALSEGSLPWAK